VRGDFDARVRAGRIATCDMVKLELLWTRREHSELVAMREDLDALRAAPMGERVWRRATDVFELLAERGPLHHRQIGIPDLLIAAAAELAELTLLHYDSHFDVVAEVTGQPVEALAPLGSL
jgi:predicted nucleic acid-binding protein